MTTMTKVFKNGNSQAVIIPVELAFDRNDLEVEIERIGDIVISTITLAELEYGVVCSGENSQHNRQALSQLLEDNEVMPLVPALQTSMARCAGRPETAGTTHWTNLLQHTPLHWT